MTDENSLHDRRDDDCLFAAVALVYFTLLVLAAAVAVVVILEGRWRKPSRLAKGPIQAASEPL
jgi:uncharacterized BrkB/YihY/UPF0761 family membrane protein